MSTYRLQVNKNFTLNQAAECIPYLRDLGITDVYSSSVLMATPGSLHGYDICDPGRINPEIGGEEAFRKVADLLKALDMGFVVDFVPNHMGINETVNHWWRNVLENGPSSRFARFFDIDWTPLKRELRDKVLLPILGEQYGEALKSGKLQLEFEADGGFSLRYYDRNFPLNPRQLPILLNHKLDRLKSQLTPDDPQLTEFLSVLFHLEHLPAYEQTDMVSVADRQREKEVAKRRLAALVEESPAIRRHVEENLATFNGTPGDSASFDLLHSLLEAQPYRLAYWRTATHEINYRRFFDINELAGIRMEESEVFDACHELILRFIREGLISGLRLDHVDGLFDPKGYFDRLQEAFGDDRRVYVLVEKILSEGERVDGKWAVHGTTGYEFLNGLNGLYVDKSAAREFQKLYTRITGSKRTLTDIVYSAKKLIIETSMASELHVLAYESNRISESDRRYRDFTLLSLQDALTEVVACFPIYRTYVSATGASEFDKANLDLAIREAQRRNPVYELSIFQFIRSMLLPEPGAELPAEEFGRQLRFAMKFQQYTGPVQAKGVEDTAFYRYCPLLSLNEVGGAPTRFGIRTEDFHEANRERLERFPLAMLASSTHDTKRGEDARARINVLSEIPKLWREKVTLWMRINSSARTIVMGEPAPDRSDEYFYYQALLGSWPAGCDEPQPEFVERMRQYLNKATKEKKVHTSWITPSAEYDAAVSNFVESTLTGTRSKPFLAQFLPFQKRVAELGMMNSLSQLVLKIASPGVPDFYQGSEMWNVSMVDPDNRRPVDFAGHAEVLGKILSAANEGPPCCARRKVAEEVLANWTDGRIKLYVTAMGLRARRGQPDLFLKGEYIPLGLSGSTAAHAVGVMRKHGDATAVVLAPRLVTTLVGFNDGLALGDVWSDGQAVLPEGFGGKAFQNMLTGERLQATPEGHLPLADVFRIFPVAWLTPVEEHNDESAR